MFRPMGLHHSWLLLFQIKGSIYMVVHVHHECFACTHTTGLLSTFIK